MKSLPKPPVVFGVKSEPLHGTLASFHSHPNSSRGGREPRILSVPSLRSQTPHVCPRGPPIPLPSPRTRPSTRLERGFRSPRPSSNTPHLPTPLASLCLPSSKPLCLSSRVLGTVGVIQRGMRENCGPASNRFLNFFQYF